MTLKLAVASELPKDVDQKLLQRAVATVAKAIPNVPGGTINLKLVDDSQIQALNKNYSGIDQATDVLSFSYIEDGMAPVEGELGDIATSVETAARQALASETTLETEIVLLLVHGCLHVLGYDHAHLADQARLEALQAQIMAQLGLTYRNFKWDSSKV